MTGPRDLGPMGESAPTRTPVQHKRPGFFFWLTVAFLTVITLRIIAEVTL